MLRVLCIQLIFFLFSNFLINYIMAQNCFPACLSAQKCVLGNCVLDIVCPIHAKFGPGPPYSCAKPSDPLNKGRSKLELWFTKEIFDDLFPKANIGWGPNPCFPYSYESFVIAARYFPNFGTEAPGNGYNAEQNYKRDLAAFFAHAFQETGEIDGSLYNKLSRQEADACFYRGGFYNWFEGGPRSGFLPSSTPGLKPEDGNMCSAQGLYCSSSDPFVNFAYPCNKAQNGYHYEGCYFGRGPIQITHNYNYGMFQHWLLLQGINVDLLTNPNLIMTKTDPPLSIMASLWFYMTPQPPKPAMHDIILGNWEPSHLNRAMGYFGPILGPTSLIINNECHGEGIAIPGGGGENRRIKAFRWFCSYFNVPTGADVTLSCKNMVQKFDEMNVNLSWQPDWTSAWKEQTCTCAPQTHQGLIPYYQPGYYPDRFINQNEGNRLACAMLIYSNPNLFHMNVEKFPCLKYPHN